MSGGNSNFEVFRGDRPTAARPSTIKVPVDPGMVVLDALHYIQAPPGARSRRPLELQSRASAAPAPPKSTAARA